MAAEIRTLYDGDTEVLPRTTASAVSTEDGTSVDVALQKNKKDLLDHIEDKDNPHGVTAAQVGAAEAVHSHVKADISDFAHTHTKADISDFPTEMAPTAHTHNATDVMTSDGATVEAKLTEISGQIGDISTMLDNINGEVI